MIFRFLADILIAEKIMIGLPAEDEDEKEENEGEKEKINIEANIPAETERESVKIVEKTTKEQEPTVARYLPVPWDEQDDELKILRNKNTFLKVYVIELERKIEKMEDEKTQKAELKKKRRERREKRKLRKQQYKIKVKDCLLYTSPSPRDS